MKRIIYGMIVLIIALVALYLMPLTTTVSQVTDSGYTFVTPVLSNYQKDENNNAFFMSLRSHYALQKDIKNALATYEPVTCKLVTYYYDESQDYAINDVSIQSSFLVNTIIYNYQKGNPCEGWTTDMEVKYPFGNSDEITSINIEELSSQNNMIITNDEVINIHLYDNFLVNQNNGILDYLRIINVASENSIQIIDLQYTSQNNIIVTIDDTRYKDESSTSDVSEYTYDRVASAEIDHGVWIVAYNGNDSTVDDRMVLVKTSD